MAHESTEEIEWTWRLRLSYLWVFIPVLMFLPLIGLTIHLIITKIGMMLDATTCTDLSTQNVLFGWFTVHILILNAEIFLLIVGIHIRRRDWMVEHTPEKSNSQFKFGMAEESPVEFEWTWGQVLSYLCTILPLPMLVDLICGMFIFFYRSSLSCADLSSRNDILLPLILWVPVIEIYVFFTIYIVRHFHRRWWRVQMNNQTGSTSTLDRDAV